MASSLLSKINGVALSALEPGRLSLACRSSRGRVDERVSKTEVAGAPADPTKLSQAAVAAFAAGCLALSGPSYATESGIMPSRNRDEDNAARAMLDKKEAKIDAPAVQGRMEDKSSGNVDDFQRKPKGKYPMQGANEKAFLGEQLETLPATHGNSNSKAAPRELSVEAVASLVQGGPWSYLDVRTKEEFAGGHSPGAVNIPIMESGPAGMTPNAAFVDQVAAQFPDPATAQLVVGCQFGPRSSKAVEILSGQQYQHLIRVIGGYPAWEGAGLPIEK